MHTVQSLGHECEEKCVQLLQFLHVIGLVSTVLEALQPMSTRQQIGQ